ncbi:MAG: PqiC family protein [Caldimonas sp.]
MSGGKAGIAATTSVVLEPIRLPAQVDRPQWLVRLPDGSLALLEQDRWASPLGDEMRQALLETLSARYGIAEARNAPGTTPLRVALDVRRFDSVPGQEALIEGSWTIVSGEGGKSSKRCEWSYREPAAPGLQPLAAAHRRAWAKLGDAIGAGLVQASRHETVGCVAPL